MKSFMIKHSGLRFLTLFAVVCLTCAIVVAENGDEDSQKPPASEASPKREVLTTLEQRMLKRVSVDFRNTPIEDVIRIMAEQADVDIVKSPKVTGVVTATLTDVPLEEALNNILVAHGYGYVLGNNLIRIAPADEISEQAERLVNRIYRITYTDVAAVEKALQKFISNRGSLSSNVSTSNIIVTDTETKIKAIDTFINEIDRITPQILVEARIYDITSKEKLDLGIEWNAGRNSVYVDGEPTGGPRNPFVTGTFGGATSKADDTTGTLRFGFLNSSIDLDIQLRAEQEDVDARLLANPRILVLDNETAFFDIVTEHPYVERTITGSTVTETIKFKPVGIKLEVTPHVTRDGMLRLHIIPEFGIKVSDKAIGSGDSRTTVPVVDTRKVNTIALVKDGQTVVLGGMRKKDVTKQINKIPFFGDLPLVGGLFRFEGEDTAVTELVVFITPRIIKESVLSETEKRAYELTEFSGPEVTPTRAEASKDN